MHVVSLTMRPVNLVPRASHVFLPRRIEGSGVALVNAGHVSGNTPRILEY